MITFIIVVNAMDPHMTASYQIAPYQTAAKGAVWSGCIVSAIYATKVHKQMREKTTIVANGGK